MTPVAAAKATRPEPAGKETPIGKRVWLSPPVPHGVGQGEAIEPGVDDAVAGLQRDAAAAGEEAGQFRVGLDVDRLRVGRGMAEGLHDEIGREAEAGEVLQLVARHRAGRVLAADGGHLGFAIGARTHALAFRQTAGAADDLLGEREPLAALGRLGRRPEQRGGREPERCPCARGEPAADDQRNAAAGAHLVEDHVGLQLELGDDGAVANGLALVRAGVRRRRPSPSWRRRARSAGRRRPPWCCRRSARSWRRGRRRRTACSGRTGCPGR